MLQQTQTSTGDSESADADLKEIVAAQFNRIRFPHYRIASKLRYLQKASNFHLIDLFNTLEAFREFGLNGNPDLHSLVPNSQVYSLIDWAFVQLRQRLPIARSQAINVHRSTDLVYNWIVETFDGSQTGYTNLLALKTALTLLCSATYSNKLRYLFTLLSADGPFLIEAHFDLYLRHILAVAQYFEDIAIFFYDEELHSSIFNFSTAINSTAFIEVLTNYENQAEFTAWLIVYHRLADAELVTHQTSCSCCQRAHFKGFRYKCKKCSNYNLCEDCFWTGESSGSHDPNTHPCKEYLFEKPKHQLRQSIRKSFRNSFRRSPKKAAASSASALSNDDHLTRKHLNLTNIIASPTSQRKRQSSATAYDYRFYDIALDSSDSITNLGDDEEHSLIAHYLYLLNAKSRNEIPVVVDSLFSGDVSNVQSYEKTIEQLESKNRHLMEKIAQLRQVKVAPKWRAAPSIISDSHSESAMDTEQQKSVFFDELLGLRRKKDDLEQYLSTLQDRRKVLMVQLDNLMREFKDLDINGNSGPGTVERQYSTQSEMEAIDDRELLSGR